MVSVKKNFFVYDEVSILSGEGILVGIVVLDWNVEIIYVLYEGCFDILVKYGVKEDKIYME